MIICNWKL